MSLKYAILGIVSTKPRTGYDIKRIFGESVGLIWTATHSQIYTTLHQSKKEGLISSDLIIQDGKPNKIIYYITEKGQKDFQAWLSEPNTIPELKDGFLLKFIYATGTISDDILLSNLEAGLKIMQDRYDTLSKVLKRNSYAESKSLSFAGRMGLANFSIYISFIIEAIETLKNGGFSSSEVKVQPENITNLDSTE